MSYFVFFCCLFIYKPLVDQLPRLGKRELRTSHEVLFNLPRFQTLMSRPMHN